MTEWTAGARALIERHLERHRSRFKEAGAEADEVVADIRRHVENEAAAERLGVVTEDDAQRLLARVSPELIASPTAGGTGEVPRRESGPTATGTSRWWGWTTNPLLVWILGVLLPAVTLIFELATSACASVLFDPAPTWLHGFLIALVPVANAATLLHLRRGTMPAPRWLWRLHDAGTGVAALFALAFLPVTPFAILGALALIGLLPLSPLLAWICARRLGESLAERARTAASPIPARRWIVWMAVGILLLAPSVPDLLTQQWLRTAVHGEPVESVAAVRRLRRFGREQELLRMCYEQRRLPWGGLLDTRDRPRPTTGQAQDIYFRVTGRPYNAVKPRFGRVRGPGAVIEQDFEWDEATGGDAVAGHVSGLSLLASRLDAMADADDGWGYTEWTLEFRNDHGSLAREARAEVLLPPGGVVSRLTLWVNGEEREAAFAGRGAVRAAYQKVAVVQRRDPVLVTTSGPDRVLMQCYPVPAGGGTMKVRLGITAPLPVIAADEVGHVWPRLVERNFAIRDDLRHHAWLEARQPAIRPSSIWTPDAGRSNALHAAIGGGSGGEDFPVIHLKRTAGETSAWVRDEHAAIPSWIRQKLVEERNPAGGRLALVLDGGRDGGALADALRSALEQVDGRGEIGVWIAHDGVIEAYRGGSIKPLKEVADLISSKFPSFVGGHDAVPALESAWNWAGERPDGTVVWLHGPQPLLLGDVHSISQKLQRTSTKGVRLLDVQGAFGPNRTARELGLLAGYVVVPRLGTLAEDLRRVFREWAGGTRGLKWIREVTHREPAAGATASRHLVRLWALDEVSERHRARQIDSAVDLAARWQLVTPVTGAVVLETRQQFTEAGLTPVDPLTTPQIVPEPSTGALLMVGIGLWLWLGRRRPS